MNIIILLIYFLKFDLFKIKNNTLLRYIFFSSIIILLTINIFSLNVIFSEVLVNLIYIILIATLFKKLQY